MSSIRFAAAACDCACAVLSNNFRIIVHYSMAGTYHTEEQIERVSDLGDVGPDVVTSRRLQDYLFDSAIQKRFDSVEERR